MRLGKMALCIDHLRLDPKAELAPTPSRLFRKPSESVRNLPQVDRPFAGRLSRRLCAPKTADYTQ